MEDTVTGLNTVAQMLLTAPSLKLPHLSEKKTEACASGYKQKTGLRCELRQPGCRLHSSLFTLCDLEI